MRLKNLTYTLLCLAPLFAGCVADCDAPGKQGRTVHMTVDISRGDGQTRTSLNEENGNLSCAWSDDDCLLVTDASGNRLGKLTVSSIDPEDKSKAVFEGDIENMEDGQTTVNYIYLGNKGENGATVSENSFKIDYSGQDGSIESLSNHDVMTLSHPVTVKNGEAYVSDVKLMRRVSFAKFRLSLPENAKIDDSSSVTVSGDGLNAIQSIDLRSLVATRQAGNVTVKPLADNSFYMTLLPNDNEEGFNLTFTVKAGETSYTGTFPVSHAIAEGKYYRKANSDGTFDAIEVAMNPDAEPADDELVGPVFEVNGKKFRFTRANLKYNVDTKEWSLMEHQWSFICQAGWTDLNGNWCKTKVSEIDLFGWGANGNYDINFDETAQKPEFWRQTDRQTYTQAHYYYPTNNTSVNEGYTGSDLEHGIQFTGYDWGSAYFKQKNVEDPNALRYFTLSSSDWTALRADYFMAGATITDIPNPNNQNKKGLWGCLIFRVKDKESAKKILQAVSSEIVITSALSDNLNFSGTNYQYFDYRAIRMTQAEFEALEQTGEIVFLPEAGHKGPESVTKTDGYYWTATGGQSTTAVMFRFDGDSSPKVFKLDAQIGRSLGGAVRLAKEVSVNDK